MKVKMTMAIAALAAASALSSCSRSDPKISYTDPNAVQTISLAYSSTDLQSITNKMVDSMLNAPRVAKITAGTPPVLFISTVQNNTSEHINVQSLTNAISTRLINSGKFNFIDPTQIAAVKRQLNFQHKSGMVNQSTAVQLGKQIGAHYMLYGDIASMSARNSKVQTLDFQVTMKLMNIQTGLIVWQGEKQIAKKAERKGFGW